MEINIDTNYGTVIGTQVNNTVIVGSPANGPKESEEAVDVEFEELETASDGQKRTGIYALEFDSNSPIEKISEVGFDDYFNENLFDNYNIVTEINKCKNGNFSGHLSLDVDSIVNLGSKNFCMFVNHLGKEGFIPNSKDAKQAFVYLFSGRDSIVNPMNACQLPHRETPSNKTVEVNNLAFLVKFLVSNRGSKFNGKLIDKKNPFGDKYQISQKLFMFEDAEDDDVWAKACIYKDSGKTTSKPATAYARSAEPLLKNIVYKYFVEPVLNG